MTDSYRRCFITSADIRRERASSCRLNSLLLSSKFWDEPIIIKSVTRITMHSFVTDSLNALMKEIFKELTHFIELMHKNETVNKMLRRWTREYGTLQNYHQIITKYM